MEAIMKLKTNSLVAMCAIALGTVASFSASAAMPPVAGIAGSALSSVAGCPYINWRLANHTDGSITGRFWYGDLSGDSVALGNIDKTGKFHVQLTSAIGSGPVGVIDGQKSADGKIVADLVGVGCANFHSVTMPPILDIGNSKDTP
jgi:hypothetical protein